MKKLVALVLALVSIFSFAAPVQAEEVGGYKFADGGLLGLKVEPLTDELRESLQLEAGKSYYLFTMGIRSNDEGITNIKMSLPLDKDVFVVPEPYDNTIISGGYFSNVVEKNYNTDTGFVLFEGTTDQPANTASEVNEVFGFVAQVKETNTKPSSTIRLQGVEEGQVAAAILGGSTEGENLYTGLLEYTIDNLPVAQTVVEEPVTEEPVEVTETPVDTAPEVIETVVDTSTGAIVKEIEIETGTKEVGVTLALMLLTLLSVFGVILIRKES